jgi:hypothetical protein
MHVLIIALALLICVLGLVFGLLGVLQELTQRVAESPVFRESGPVFHGQDGASPQARSQFAWQSRSHFREPD